MRNVRHHEAGRRAVGIAERDLTGPVRHRINQAAIRLRVSGDQPGLPRAARAVENGRFIPKTGRSTKVSA
jgi:hypothetical protein